MNAEEEYEAARRQWDLNAHGSSPHLHRLQQSVSAYEQFSHSQLDAESDRLGAELSRVRRSRQVRLAVGFLIASTLGVGALWAASEVALIAVGTVGAAMAVVIGCLAFRLWAEPGIDEDALSDDIELIGRLRHHRETWEPPLI